MELILFLQLQQQLAVAAAEVMLHPLALQREVQVLVEREEVALLQVP
jgi:hypothetical protein